MLLDEINLIIPLLRSIDFINTFEILNVTMFTHVTTFKKDIERGSEKRPTANIRKTAGPNARILKGALENLERDLQQIMNVSA